MVEYDESFITKTKKFLLDNSSDLSTTPRYKELCEEYGFEHCVHSTNGKIISYHPAKSAAEYVGAVRHRESAWLDTCVGEIGQLRRRD